MHTNSKLSRHPISQSDGTPRHCTLGSSESVEASFDLKGCGGIGSRVLVLSFDEPRSKDQMQAASMMVHHGNLALGQGTQLDNERG